jgi:hypothetical protein
LAAAEKVAASKAMIEEIGTMNRRLLMAALGAALAAAGISGCAQQAGPRVRIDPQADAALRKMSTTLGKATSFSFDSVATMDEPVETGQLVQFSRDSHVVVHRPNCAFVRTEMGKDVWILWYQGTNLTLLDKIGNSYASAKVPGQIDAMLDAAAKEHGLTVPLADLLFSDPYKALTTGALTGKYIGQFVMAGAKCDHLLFTHDAIDWQIWIDAGTQTVPRQIVIDYKRLPGRPQFSVVLSDWNLAVPAGSGQFKSVLPKDARQVELKKLIGEAEGK